ncbi:MAG TPA: ribbon-helix-helix protein, CopG family [Candidatus Saccharimonadales bacterium]|nr:ribbon-helix-helix protein, CopG family [Candidatus Saccharimonadales bacterium]
MSTISISLDDKLKREIERFSKEDGVSKSVVIRRLVERAAWEREWSQAQKTVQAKARELGVDTMSIDELEDFLG